MKLNFQKITKTALVLVYLVIVAGALVRMTGSGMGCPDWPKCFGYYIPPTDIKELQWKPNREFKRGQVIIKDEKLWVAKQTFTTAETYNEANWEHYTKHDYAEFNPMHTWVEYINRLTGALAGLAVLAMAFASFRFAKTKSSIILLSWLTVFLMGFQAWLGATVVYSVLNPVKITLHMVVALIIVAVILYILDISKDLSYNQKKYRYDKLFKGMLWFSLGLTLVQIVMGTQVRQFVDEQIKLLGYENISLVMDEPTVNFYVHRSFSIIVLFTNIVLFNRNKKFSLGFSKMSWVLALLTLEIISGIAMYNFDFPFASQTIHVVSASLLFGIQFYMILESRRNKVVTV
ncbi:heme A synthase [Flavobacterium sp. Sd200]|uniref:COX15/CtaA family protein n=1 Tax=Flavobacterium sp. Sd200 TaxID=2692211 RepID=UPI00136E87FB|nr:COX15/CtaA family protein [Flavobacterium sp. Sd200]MXN89721.1 heme A synthase [Flavobacterium sp. Sd200]